MKWIRDDNGRLLNLSHVLSIEQINGKIYLNYPDGNTYFLFESPTKTEAETYLEMLLEDLDD